MKLGRLKGMCYSLIQLLSTRQGLSPSGMTPGSLRYGNPEVLFKELTGCRGDAHTSLKMQIIKCETQRGHAIQTKMPCKHRKKNG